MNLINIQNALKRQNLDGWLFFDHHERDPLAYRILGLPSGMHVTRRWYYMIPAEGDPVGLVHRIEAGVINPLPGEKIPYSSWQEQHTKVASLLAGKKRIAMQYSPLCAVPYVAMVDAGTVELVRSLGVEVVSSAELITEFEAVLSNEQFDTHVAAGRIVDKVRAGAFQLIREKLSSGIDELTVRDWVLAEFAKADLYTEHGPIVAVNAHAGDPHFEPGPATNTKIKSGDLVLIDMWAKFNKMGSVFYDITWTGAVGTVSSEIENVFDIVRDARDLAVKRVKEGKDLRGFEVDDAAREYIKSKGYGDQFVHRTGHSIGEEVHGTGANMDNLETHDDRRILPGSLFSVEPGLYFPHFGIRNEVNVFVNHAGIADTTGEIQNELVRI